VVTESPETSGARSLRGRQIPQFAASSVFPSRHQVGLTVVLGAIFLIALAPKVDPDVWWHLRDGAYITAHHVVPTNDLYSFTFVGHAWTDHQWLSELLIYACYQIGGLWGTIFVFSLITCATFGLVYLRMTGMSVNWLLSLFVLCGAFIASTDTWGARPQMISLLLLSVLALLTQRFLQSRDRRLLAGLPLIMLLWTNLDSGWVLGLTYVAITLFGEWINNITRHEDSLAPRDLRALGITLLITAAASVLSPNGISQLSYPLGWLIPFANLGAGGDWFSVDFHKPVFMVFEGLVLLLIACFYLARKKLNWTHLLLILAFTNLALSQSRDVAVWSVAISPLLALYLQDVLLSWRHYRDTQSSGARQLPDGSPAPAGAEGPAAIVRPKPLMEWGLSRSFNLVLLCLALLFYGFEARQFIGSATLGQTERDSFPRGALSYMDRHVLPSRTFTSYAWGGYLLWRGYPRYRDFIDGRAGSLYNSKILNADSAIYDADPSWQTLLATYRVGTVLVSPDAPVAQVLALNAGWRKVYRDATAILYTRR
jgi:hypothetical protein